MKTFKEFLNEDYDLLTSLQSAREGHDIHLKLNNGIEIPLDETTATVLIAYLGTVNKSEQDDFMESLITDERSFFRALEIANHSVTNG